MRFERWWPMKPFTPRMRILFICPFLVQGNPAGADVPGEFLRGQRPAVQFRLENLEHASVGARGQAAAGFAVEKRALHRGPPAFEQPRAQQAQPLALDFRKRAGVGRGDRPYEIVNALRRSAPVDAAVFWPAPSEITAQG